MLVSMGGAALLALGVGTLLSGRELVCLPRSAPVSILLVCRMGTAPRVLPDPNPIFWLGGRGRCMGTAGGAHRHASLLHGRVCEQGCAACCGSGHAGCCVPWQLTSFANVCKACFTCGFGYGRGALHSLSFGSGSGSGGGLGGWAFGACTNWSAVMARRTVTGFSACGTPSCVG